MNRVRSFTMLRSMCACLFKSTLLLFLTACAAQAQLKASEVGFSFVPQITQTYSKRGPTSNPMLTNTFAYRVGADLVFNYRYSKVGIATGLYYNYDLFKGKFSDTLRILSPPSKELTEGDFRQSYSFIEVPLGLTLNLKIKKAIVKVNAGIIAGWSLRSYQDEILTNGKTYRFSVRSEGPSDINNLRSYLGVGIGLPVKEKLYILIQPNVMFNLSDGLKNPIYDPPFHFDNELFANVRFSIIRLL